LQTKNPGRVIFVGSGRRFAVAQEDILQLQRPARPQGFNKGCIIAEQIGLAAFKRRKEEGFSVKVTKLRIL